VLRAKCTVTTAFFVSGRWGRAEIYAYLFLTPPPKDKNAKSPLLSEALQGSHVSPIQWNAARNILQTWL
jgi:hypothetical protein